ncbi:hypothetical protein EYC84_006465 [Monilinia fructicola]|uniref:Uncharacterized protein n=1 Tax=Monilinia fructicola TaxID=38448 RepID=A0A5M9K5Z3_MONFR|nr:hypothetical protein EYC84_006465 [Monilinia fructicola]
MSSTFPSELSALSNSARSPFPGYADFMIKQEDSIKTPITPPLAYTDFLKTMNSPIVAEKHVPDQHLPLHPPQIP